MDSNAVGLLQKRVTARQCGADEETGAPPIPMLLSRRMAAIELHPAAVARCVPAPFHVLETGCVKCEYCERCRQDLKDSRGSRGWTAYCPNAVLLDALNELWWLKTLL
jgi:hypothetical protein